MTLMRRLSEMRRQIRMRAVREILSAEKSEIGIRYISIMGASIDGRPRTILLASYTPQRPDYSSFPEPECGPLVLPKGYILDVYIRKIPSLPE